MGAVQGPEATSPIQDLCLQKQNAKTDLEEMEATFEDWQLFQGGKSTAGTPNCSEQYVFFGGGEFLLGSCPELGKQLEEEEHTEAAARCK